MKLKIDSSSLPRGVIIDRVGLREVDIRVIQDESSNKIIPPYVSIVGDIFSLLHIYGNFSLQLKSFQRPVTPLIAPQFCFRLPSGLSSIHLLYFVGRFVERDIHSPSVTMSRIPSQPQPIKQRLDKYNQSDNQIMNSYFVL